MSRRLDRSPIKLLSVPQAVFQTRPAPSALLVDIEGTLTGFSPSAASVAEAILAFDESALQSGLELRRVHYVSNAKLSGISLVTQGISGRLHVNAHKPFFIPPNDLISCNTIVIGDQYLTDGLLAWRFGFSFALINSSHKKPWWPALQLHLGHAISFLFFKVVPG